MIRRVDAYRLHALACDGRLVGYAVVDCWGWVAFTRHRGRIRQVGRFTDPVRLRRWLDGLAAMPS